MTTLKEKQEKYGLSMFFFGIFTMSSIGLALLNLFTGLDIWLSVIFGLCPMAFTGYMSEWWENKQS